MPDLSVLIGFVAAALVVLVTPGPGVLYVVARSLSQGQRAGIISVLGLSSGALVHVAAATLGLSAILLTSAAAFTIVKLLGAGYLIYLGIRTLLTRAALSNADTTPPRSLSRLFVDGFVISVLNPKIAVFFLAFLPQFVQPDAGPVARQVMLLGLIYVGLALVTDGTYALVAGRARHWMRGRIVQGRAPQYATGAVYLGLGVSTAFAERP